MGEEQRVNLIKLAANGIIDSHAPTHDAVPSTPVADHAHQLTADNLEQVPEAEQLAPGIRLPESGVELSQASSDATMSKPRTPASDSGPTTPSIQEPASVPPELDPRTAKFCYGIPRSGSVFSVAAQPGSPKEEQGRDVARVATPDRGTGPAGSPMSSRWDSPQPMTPTSHDQPAAVPPSSHGSITASLALSDAGSVASDDVRPPSLDEVQEEERAIEMLRMQERLKFSGAVGIGGQTVPTAVLWELQHQRDAFSTPHRTMSTSATASNSPTSSVHEDERLGDSRVAGEST